MILLKLQILIEIVGDTMKLCIENKCKDVVLPLKLEEKKVAEEIAKGITQKLEHILSLAGEFISAILAEKIAEEKALTENAM